MKVKLQYLIEGQKVIMSTDREIVGQLKTVAKDDITSITSDDLGVVKVEVFGAWRLTRSESNVDVGEIEIPEISPVKPRSNDSHHGIKTTSKSGKQAKYKQSKASSGVEEVEL